jgi:ribonuclease R
MEFSIATLMSHLSEDKLVAAKVLEKKLGCEDEENSQKLQIALDLLEKIGLLVKERGKYRRLPAENVVEAKLRCSSKGFCFAIQDDEDSEDIYVRESNLSNAWNGDRVLVKIIKEGSRRRSPEGEIKVILERANSSLLAQVKQEDSEYRAVPLDDRLLFELELQQEEEELAQAVDHLVHVSVIRYPLAQYPPLGKVTRILGSDAEAAADTDIVCCKHDLPQSFSPEALQAAENLPKSFTASELEQRQDLRQLLAFTLTDEAQLAGTPLIENAFSLERTATGQWQLGIHIADVAHSIEADSLLDKVAKKRGTAVYLGEKIIPLFPDAVAHRCSLVPGKDRLTLSVLLLMDKNGQVREFTLQPSVIQVDHQLSFQQVQSWLANPDSLQEVEPNLADRLQQMLFTLSPLAKARRLQRGSFEIQSDTPCPYLDEGRLGAILVSPDLPVRSLLTELVILAGKAVADHFHALGVPGLYVTQSEPDWDELEDLLKLGNNLGLELALELDEDVTCHDYQNLIRSFSKVKAARILNFLLQDTLKIEKYSSHPAPHFSLAYADCYTHCVSPGQRYGDLLVQRLLKVIFEQGRDRRQKLSKTVVDLGSSTCHGQINWNVLPPDVQESWEEQFHTLISHLNDRAKVAEDAEGDLQGLKKAEKMKERTGKVFKGLITGVQSYGFFVEIEDLLVEGLVHVSSLKDDWYEYRARYSCLVGRKNRVAYRLGDEVEVEVKSVDYYRQQIDLATVGGGSTANSEDLEE